MEQHCVHASGLAASHVGKVHSSTHCHVVVQTPLLRSQRIVGPVDLGHDFIAVLPHLRVSVVAVRMETACESAELGMDVLLNVWTVDRLSSERDFEDIVGCVVWVVERAQLILDCEDVESRIEHGFGGSIVRSPFCLRGERIFHSVVRSSSSCVDQSGGSRPVPIIHGFQEHSVVADESARADSHIQDALVLAPHELEQYGHSKAHGLQADDDAPLLLVEHFHVSRRQRVCFWEHPFEYPCDAHPDELRIARVILLVEDSAFSGDHRH
mmetsp:Transcript_18754/g.54989  ORF Transcript_18754/g.54989 Transcript_18754/m.54989 type:complete len:268 (+) Transcript_18754:1768-2571(+)